MPATQPRPDRIPEPQPENARQAVAMTRDDHQWRRAVLDINSTDGIKRNIDALWAAINRLAGYIDGDRPSERPGDVSHVPHERPQTEAERQANNQTMETAKVV